LCPTWRQTTARPHSHPSDYYFARDGIAAEGTINQEQIIVADVDLDLLDEQRVNGSVIPSRT